MGLRDTVKNLANRAITTAIGDLSSTATFRSVVSGPYDPETGVLARTVTEYTCRCVLAKITQNDMVDLGVASTGMKVLVPTLQLENVNVDALDDEVSVDGIVYLVHSVKRDPSGALFTFVVTAKQGAQLDGN